jgi:hypothetical protein
MKNPEVVKRFEELIGEGEERWTEYEETSGNIDPIRLTKWTTSCLNLLDRLSISTNRFVKEFEAWGTPGPGKQMNLGASLGVMKSAFEEYIRGFAIDYHLSVASAVFGGLLAEADYLLSKGYYRAAAVLIGAALEESLKSRARAVPIEITEKDTLVPVIYKLKAPHVGVLTEVQAKRLEAIARLRNDAAHGGEFNYKPEDVKEAFVETQTVMDRILNAR